MGHGQPCRNSPRVKNLRTVRMFRPRGFPVERFHRPGNAAADGFYKESDNRLPDGIYKPPEGRGLEAFRGSTVMDRPESLSQPPGLSADRETALPLFLLRASDAARLCRVSLRTWRAWDATGKVPQPVRIGRAVFWRLEELRSWVAAGCPDRETWQSLP